MVPGSDGRVHPACELLLTNAFKVPVTVTSVEVLDAKRESVGARLDGAALTASMSLLTGGPPGTELPPSTTAVVWFDVTLTDRAFLPAVVAHRVTADVPPGLGMTTSVTSGGRAEVNLRPSVVLGPPLLGPRWVAVGSCCDGPHRRGLFALNGQLFLSQRFAIDFNRLDGGERFTAGDPRRNESMAGDGQPLIAVADAVVVAATDRFPDRTPGDRHPVDFEEIPGNQVILDLGGGRFAFDAHLQPGSVAVREGDHVVRGQLLGQLGNSSGVHPHFHVMDRPSPQVADGLPYGPGQNALPLGEDEVTFLESVPPGAVWTGGAGALLRLLSRADAPGQPMVQPLPDLSPFWQQQGALGVATDVCTVGGRRWPDPPDQPRLGAAVAATRTSALIPSTTAGPHQAR